MDVFVARQPIFDARTRVVGYELLHRAGAQNRYTGGDAAAATRQLLAEHLLEDSWSSLTSGRPAWVNFPGELLLDGTVALVPPDRMVIELLEDITVNADMVAACRDLIGQGYLLAADDVVSADDDNPLLDVADIIKVDFRAADPEQRVALARRFGGRARLLAEKVETRSEQAEAIGLGYELLQGYFLHEPSMVSRRSLDRTRVGLLAVLAAVSKRPMDFEEVEQAVKREVSMTDKLLRYLNSAMFGWRAHITTIHAALVALGEVQLRRWVSVVAVSEIAVERPPELIASVLIRARMCELVGEAPEAAAGPLELFLTGLYSQMHVLLEMDVEETMRTAPVPDNVRAALLERSGPLWDVLELVTAWEGGDWERVEPLAGQLGVPPGQLPVWYTTALAFADAVRGVDGAAGGDRLAVSGAPSSGA